MKTRVETIESAKNPIVARANSLLRKGRERQAIRILQQEIQRGDAVPEIYGALSIVFSENKQMEKALEAAGQGLRVYPDDLGLLQVVHDCYVEMGDLEKAFLMGQRALRVAPSSGVPVFLLRECFVLGLKEESLEIIQRLQPTERLDKSWAEAVVELLGEEIYEKSYYGAIMNVFVTRPDASFCKSEVSRWLIQEYESLPDYDSVTIRGAISCLRGLRYYLLGEYQKTEEVFQQFISSVDSQLSAEEFPGMLYLGLLFFLKNIYDQEQELENPTKFIEVVKKALDFTKAIGRDSLATLPIHYDFARALAGEQRWNEALEESELVLKYEPNNVDALGINVISRVMVLDEPDKTTFTRAQKWYRQESDNHSAWSLHVQFLRRFEYFRQAVEEVDNYLNEFAGRLTQQERLVVLDALLASCSETKRYDLFKRLFEECQEDVLELLISLHGAKDREEALVLFDANLAALRGDFERARELAFQTSNGEVALARIELIRQEWEKEGRTEAPEITPGSKLAGEERRQIIAGLVEGMLGEVFGSTEEPKQNPEAILPNELCFSLLAREPKLGSLSDAEKKRIIRQARRWCDEQKTKARNRQVAVGSNGFSATREKLFSMGNMHEQVVVLCEAIDWLARARRFKTEEGKSLLLVPQFGDWQGLNGELIIPDVYYGKTLADAKLGRAEENIRDTILKYFIVQLEHGSVSPIWIIVGKVVPEVVRGLREDPYMWSRRQGRHQPIYQLVGWDEVLSKALGKMENTLSQVPRFSKEQGILRSIEKNLRTLEDFPWRNNISVAQLEALEILLFHCWHGILEHNPFYITAIRNTESLSSKFPVLLRPKKASEIKLMEQLNRQLANVVILTRQLERLKQPEKQGRRIFPFYFGRVLTKGLHYASDDDGRILYVPNPFSEEDLERPFFSPFEAEEPAGTEVIRVSEKGYHARKPGERRPVDIYQGKTGAPKYIHEVVRALIRLAGQPGKYVSFPEIFKQFLQGSLGQSILQGEYRGNKKLFASRVRSSMYASRRLNVQPGENGVLTYAVNPRYWRDKQNEG